MPYRRELHCHIIPGVDDGSSRMEASLAYLTALSRFGVERVIFTPHRTDPYFQNTPQIIQPIFDQLKQAVTDAEIAIEAENFSFEYRLDSGFLRLRETGKFGDPGCAIRPLHGRYLLIENAFSHPFAGIEQVVEALQSDGYYLILAHPERYLYYAGHKGYHYERLQEMQVEFQCNLLSFAGYYGETPKRSAYWMLEHGYVNFLGSDLHNAHHVELIEKFLRSKEYAAIREDLAEYIGNDHLDD